MDISTLRALFPVTEKAVYLNNAVEAPLNLRTRQKLDHYLALASEAPHKRPSVRTPVRASLSMLLGGKHDDYALVTSTGVGVGLVAAGYNWQPGDNVVLPAEEHWNNTFPWKALYARGVEVRLAPVGEDQRIDPAAVAALVDDKTRIVASAAVRFNTGFRSDLKRLSTIAHAYNALFMVDGIQGAGMVPINVEEDGIDILACGGFKWLLGLHGSGFLYVNDQAQEKISPLLPGIFAAKDNSRALDYYPDARRYETGAIAYGLFYAWTAGLELLKDVGVSNIYARALKLTDRLIAGLRAKNLVIASPIENPCDRSAIVSFSVGSPLANQKLYERLLSQDIVVAFRDGRIRVSPNFFNTEADIDQLLQAL